LSLQRRIVRFLGSPRLALWLLVFIGVWSIAATAVPQVGQPATTVSSWADEFGLVGTIAPVLGLDTAFSAPVFILAVALLALSTATCSWNRTKAALLRSRSLSDAAHLDRTAFLSGRPDLEMDVPPNLGDSEVLAVASATLKDLRIRTQERDGVVRSVSPPWSVWGSPVFHWALLALIVAALAGVLMRTVGSMVIPVGAAKTNERASYTALRSGPWATWMGAKRTIRVDAFDPRYVVENIDRGAVPTVSVLDGDGKVLVTQRVYANKKLHSGSLSINAPGCGLTVSIAIMNPDGAEISRPLQLVEFSQEASGGTVPLNPLALRDRDGNTILKLTATVPIDRIGDGYGEWIPAEPAAHVVLVDGQGKVLVDSVVRQGDRVPIAGGGYVRIAEIGWYSRLSLVDDPTIPYIYIAMVIATLGLSLSVLAPQRLLVAAVEESEGDRRLVMSLRLWRNNPTNRAEIERELTRALNKTKEARKS